MHANLVHSYGCRTVQIGMCLLLMAFTGVNVVDYIMTVTIFLVHI